LPGLLEDLLDQGSLMIVLDIQVEDALIQVHHANKLLAAGSPQPDPFHRLAPYDGISDTLRRARDGGRGPRPANREPRPMLPRRTFTVLHWIAELLIDCEGDRTLRAVLVGMLR
jgi:hypothetical protein